MKNIFRLIMLASFSVTMASAKDWDSLRCRKNALIPGGSGERPSHVAIETCGPASRAIIACLKFPENEIHCCAEREIRVDGQRRSVVWVMYGPGEDCIAGCGYHEWVGLWDGIGAYSLPDPRREVLVGQAIHEGFLVERKSAEVLPFDSNRAKVDISWRSGHYGWEVVPPDINIRETKFGSQQTLFDSTGNMLNVAIRCEEIWSGTLFTYNDEAGALRVDPSRMTKTSREITVFQECRYQKDPPPGRESYECGDYQEGIPPLKNYNPSR